MGKVKDAMLREQEQELEAWIGYMEYLQSQDPSAIELDKVSDTKATEEINTSIVASNAVNNTKSQKESTMKLTRYQFEKSVQEASPESTEWLQEEFKAILESGKEHTAKADYIGYSILSIDSKIKVLDEQIKELQDVKSKLKEAKQIAITVGAEVLVSYGITKIEGAGISSVTLSKPSNKSSKVLHVEDEELLIQAGYYRKVLDEDAVMEALKHLKYRGELGRLATVETVIAFTPAKLKINKRRSKVQEPSELKDAS